MTEQSFDEQAAHLHFAKQINGHLWKLLETENRTPVQDEEMLDAAHASLYHWRHAGGIVHLQRGAWMLYRVHRALGHPEIALEYAQSCMDWTQRNPDEMEDFDLGYAEEAMARSLAMNGDMEQAGEHYRAAKRAGEAIADEEDKEIYMGDLAGGDWFGLPVDDMD